VALDLPEQIDHNILYLYDRTIHSWKRLSVTTSSQIRTVINPETMITTTKLLHLDADDAKKLFFKLHKISSMLSRCRLLRLIHGDVFCGSRTLRTGLTSTDRCIRCFDEETILHLLLRCPYSKRVWDLIGIHCERPEEIVDPDIGIAELELRADIINELVFRKRHLPPDILIETIFNKFANGLSKNKAITKYARDKVSMFRVTGEWFN
jgi:hypothetical protein